jgi:hypothetical protein
MADTTNVGFGVIEGRLVSDINLRARLSRCDGHERFLLPAFLDDWLWITGKVVVSLVLDFLQFLFLASMASKIGRLGGHERRFCLFV